MRLSAVPEKAWLGLVSLAYVVSVIALTPMNALWAWDEAVYASQISRHVPMVWAATRGRGMPLIDAPVTLFTGSEVALRVYLTLLAGVALFVTLLIWSRFASFKVTVIAGLLWSSIWIVTSETSQNMGNLWLAYAIAIATGLFLLYATHISAGLWTLAGLGVASFAATMLHGPTDGVFLLLGLLACLPFAEKADRLRLGVAAAAGVILGVLEWVVEAYLYFHGPLHRIALAKKDGSGFGFFASKYAASLDGGHGGPVAVLWWCLLLVLLGAGIFYAIRQRERVYVVALIVGAAVLLEYLLFIPLPYARYMLPSFALWSFVAALGVNRLITYRKNVVLPMALAAILILGVAAQSQILAAVKHVQIVGGDTATAVAQTLHARGIHAPCSILGGPETGGMSIAYYSGCAGAYAGTRDNYTSLAARRSVVVLVRTGLPVPVQVQHWQKQAIGPLMVYSKLRSAPLMGGRP